MSDRHGGDDDVAVEGGVFRRRGLAYVQLDWANDPLWVREGTWEVDSWGEPGGWCFLIDLEDGEETYRFWLEGVTDAANKPPA